MNKNELTELICGQCTIHKTLKIIGSNIDKKKTTVERGESYYRIKIGTLEETWQKFNKNHFLIGQSEKDIVKEYLEINIFEEVEFLYTEYMVKVRDGLPKFDKNEVPTQNENKTTSKGKTHLPKITIPKFDGDYRTWT